MLTLYMYRTTNLWSRIIKTLLSELFKTLGYDSSRHSGMNESKLNRYDK